MRPFGKGSWGSLSRAVKLKDVPDAHPVRSGVTNLHVLMFFCLTLKYLLLAKNKALSWSNFAVTYCNYQVLRVQPQN